jgi:hypothetical protein
MKKSLVLPLKTSALLLLFLLLYQNLPAQLQWYQNQEGPNQYPNGTNAGSIYNFNTTSFIATYLWQTENDQVTWKISRTNSAGTELKRFFVSGTTTNVEVRVGKNQFVYVLKKDYPPGQNPVFTVYKLNASLEISAQIIITVPGDFSITSLNAFELDDDANIYIAGDGQLQDESTPIPASFVMKINKNLVTKWIKIDTAQTSFTKVHIDRYGYVWVVEDFYSFFPDIRLQKISPNGQLVQHYTLQTDPGRYSLNTVMDKHSNLLLYGVRSAGDTAMSLYLHKFSRSAGNIIYRKNLFISAGLFINDFKVDDNGNIFSLLTQYQSSGNLNCRISRISSASGNVSWNRIMYYTQDSCSFAKLALASNDRIYAVGLRNSNIYFSKGFAVRLKKNGQGDGSFFSPDSVAFQRTHYLQDGIADRQNRLIAIGGTTDLDTLTFNSSYIRAFAVRFNGSSCEDRLVPEASFFTRGTTTENTESLQASAIISVYPNPVTEYLTITGINDGGYNRATIFNMAGERMMQQHVTGNTARIDVSSLVTGVYVVQLRSSETLKEKTVKFVVRK